MLDNFGVDFVVELTVIFKDCCELLQLFDNEIIFFDERLHCNSSAGKHLVNCDEGAQLFVVNAFIEFFYIILQRKHSLKIIYIPYLS